MRTTKNAARVANLRELLLRAGVGQYTLSMSIPYMLMLPTTTDPYAQGVVQLVQGLQRLLNEHGARLEVDGRFGEAEIRALARYAGPRWKEKSWAQLYGDVLTGRVWEGYQRNDRANTPAATDGWREDLGGSLVGDLWGSPLPLLAAGLAVWWYFQQTGEKRTELHNRARRTYRGARAAWKGEEAKD